MPTTRAHVFEESRHESTYGQWSNVGATALNDARYVSQYANSRLQLRHGQAATPDPHSFASVCRATCVAPHTHCGAPKRSAYNTYPCDYAQLPTLTYCVHAFWMNAACKPVHIFESHTDHDPSQCTCTSVFAVAADRSPSVSASSTAFKHSSCRSRSCTE